LLIALPNAATDSVCHLHHYLGSVGRLIDRAAAFTQSAVLSAFPSIACVNASEASANPRTLTVRPEGGVDAWDAAAPAPSGWNASLTLRESA
jgi:hypothetical protein